jgi:hypothetical protein
LDGEDHGFGREEKGFSRFCIQSSKKDFGAAGRGAGELAGGLPKGALVGPPKPLAPIGEPLGGSLVASLSIISFSTKDLGRPYFAAESCFNAAANFSFGDPKGGNVAILNG